MKDARELLPDYLLGLFERGEKTKPQAEIRAWPELRPELGELRQTLFWLPQSLAPVAPPPGVWNKIQSRTRPRPRWPRIAAAAVVVAVVALAGFVIYQRNAYLALSAEQARVAHWLADPGAEWKLLKTADGKAFGTLLYTKDGRSLIILSEPPPQGKVYQAWGRKTEGYEGYPVSLGVFSGRIYETRYDGFVTVGISLEPPGGSPKPTQPLGRVPVS